MKIKGLEQLRQHIPEIRSKRGVVFAISGLVSVVIFTSIFFIFVDRGFPAWMPDGEIVVMALGFLVLFRFYTQKIRLMKRLGEHAYRTAFRRFCIPGLGIVFASIAHMGYMPGPEIPDLWWKRILIALGFFLVTVGAALWIRSVTTIGLDYLVMLYVYYPAESHLVNTRVYSILRHPIYASALYIGIGLALIHANWYSLVVAMILPIFLTGWVRLVEEKELIERFPDYPTYRRSIPAFWVKLNNLPNFYHFLFNGY